MSTLLERTVLPPEELSDLTEVARMLAEATPAGARLVAPGGSQIELPADLYEVLRDVVAALSHG